MTIFVAINPEAGGGRGRRQWPSIAACLEDRLGSFDHAFSTSPGDITDLVANAAQAGARLIIAVGGDGTVNEAINGFRDTGGGIRSDVAFSAIPVGTGVDFARGVGLSSDPKTAAQRLAAGKSRSIDLGRVTFVDWDGARQSRLFGNISSLGISGVIVNEISNARQSTRLPGKVLYLLATLRALVRYQFQNVRISIDDLPDVDTQIAAIVIANNRYFGGGMLVAPDASVDDGLFDIVTIAGTSKLSLLNALRLVYSGKHLQHPAVDIQRGKIITVEGVDAPSSNPVLLDVDGEAPGHLAATFEIIPSALTLRGIE